MVRKIKIVKHRYIEEEERERERVEQERREVSEKLKERLK